MDSTNSFYNDVLAMLQDGHDMTAIAKRITEDMNKAQADYQAAQKANAVKARKHELVSNIYDAVEAYLKEFAPDMVDRDMDRDENIAAVIEGLDALIELGKEIPVKDIIKNTDTKVVKAAKEADAILQEWLDKLGL